MAGLSLTQAQKIVVLIGTTCSIGFGFAAIFERQVDTKTSAAVQPIAVALKNHVESPGHQAQIDELVKMRSDLSYIRGRIDAKWGSDEPTTPRRRQEEGTR